MADHCTRTEVSVFTYRTAAARRSTRGVLLYVLVLTLLVSATALRFTPQCRPADLAVWTDDVAHCVRMA